MFSNASNIDASHSTFSEVHRDQHVYSRTQVQGNYTVNTIVQGNQVLQRSLGLENLYRASVPSATFDSFDRHPAPACLPGTRLQLLTRLGEWVDNPNGNESICWLNGPAGSGKSAVAQSMAEKYASQHRLAASFFFSRKEILRRKAHGFFPTLACQVLVFESSIKPVLLDALEADPTIPTKVLLEQARRLLQVPIVSSTTSFSDPILIVVDSLDECDDETMAGEVVHLLGDILRHSRWPLKVLFTSRAEPHIVRAFQHPDLRSITRSLQLQDFSVDDDIRAYLRHSFRSIQESTYAIAVNNYPLLWPPDQDIETIVQKASGLFIFATTVVKYVGMNYGSPVGQLRTVIQAIQDGAGAESVIVHSTLDTLYLDVLRTIQDEEKIRLLLGSVVFAFQPLSARGLNDLLWKFKFDASYVVKSLLSVLVISSSDIESDGAVHIYHTSFRDFLTSPHRSRQYFMDPSVFHSILAHACLELMTQHLKVDMCGLGDPSTLNCEVEDLNKRCKFHIKEGVRYACRWFSHHLSQIPWDRKRDNSLIMSLQYFAGRNLLNWIEVLSLSGELDSAVLSLREAADWFQNSPNPSKETLSLFRDAERLVLMCYDSIQQAALQVYFSLPFAPAGVQIRATYAHELENKFVITYSLGEHWKPCLRSVSTGTPIKSLSISPSGRLIASAGDTPGVQLWDTLTGNNTGHFRADGASTCPVIFSPSGDYVAVGYDTGVVDVWDVSTGHRLLDANTGSHNSSVTALIFSRNSVFMASGAADATTHVWDVSSRTLKYSVAYHQGTIRCLLFSFSDNLLASCSDDSSIITSAAHSGQLVRRFKGHTSKVNTISFSPDNETIASGSDDQIVRLWDTRTGVCIRSFAGVHKKPIHRVWITADSKYVCSACEMDIYMWSTSSRRSPQHIWSVNRYYKKSATMFPAWYAKLVKLVPSSLAGHIFDTDDGTVIYTATSPDGTAIGCAYGGSILYLEISAPQRTWSKLRQPLATSSTLEEPPLFSDDSDNQFTVIAMTLDRTLLVTSGDDGVIRLWNTSPKSNWQTIHNNFKETVNGFWPALDGRSVLVKPMVGLQLVTPAGTMIKDLDTGGDSLSVVGAVPSPDSRYFAYWAEYAWNLDNSFSIYIYDASTGTRHKRIPGFFDITCGRFSAESDLFVCAHGEGVVQVWELPSAECKVTINTEHVAITALELLPGNSTLVVGSDLGHVEIRMLEDGAIVHRVKSSPSKVLALAVPNEALIVIIGHEDGSLLVWDPSYINISPHCLSPEGSEETSDNDPSDQSGIDFIKFTEGHRSICTRTVKGVVCTWDLTPCLTKYAEQEKEISEEDTVIGTITPDTLIQPSGLPNTDTSDGWSADQTISNEPGAQDDEGVPADSAYVEITSEVVLQDETSTDEPTELETQIATEELVATPTTSPPLSPSATPSLSPALLRRPPCTCSHRLLSRSDRHMVYDLYFRSAYSVDTREGWVYRGSRRMFWLPENLRPDLPGGLAAFGDRLVVLARSRALVFFDLSEIPIF